MGYEVETVSIDGGPAAVGSGGSFTLVVDRPAGHGGRGLGFSGGQLLNMAVAGCVSNDLFREADRRGLSLRRVRVSVTSDYIGSPAVSTPIEFDVELDGDAAQADLDALLDYVDTIAEIPNSIRNGTPVRLRARRVTGR
jgi:uncharacterized OsmC-like protein